MSQTWGKGDKEFFSSLKAFFFGIFFCIYQLNQISGNLISSIVLGEGLPSFGDVGNATQDCS